MAEEDDQDIFDSLEREASEFTKVSPFYEIWLCQVFGVLLTRD